MTIDIRTPGIWVDPEDGEELPVSCMRCRKMQNNFTHWVCSEKMQPALPILIDEEDDTPFNIKHDLPTCSQFRAEPHGRPTPMPANYKPLQHGTKKLREELANRIAVTALNGWTSSEYTPPAWYTKVLEE